MVNHLRSINPIWFYVPLFIVGLLATIRFAIQSGFAENALGIGLALGFASMGFGGFILLPLYLFHFSEKDDTSTKTNYSNHLHAFWIFGAGIAFLFWVIGLISPGFSIIATPFQISTVLSTVSQGLGTFDHILANTVMAPLMETFIFIGHFLFAWSVVWIISKAMSLSETTRGVMLIVLYIAFSTITFYYFHVGLVGSMGFLTAVLIYRGMMGFLVFGDKLFNIVPFATVVIAAEFGFHWVGNILNTVGFVQWVLIMLSDVFGATALMLFIFLGIAELYNIKARGGE